MSETKVIGRNEPCPCGSGSKYKRCCGKDAAPKLGKPVDLQERMAQVAGSGALPPGVDPSKLDPAMMAQFNQALMRMPRGQLQKLQSIMQRAMAGQDVTREAAELDRLMPPELKQMAQSMGMGMGMPGAAAAAEPDLSEAEARKIVEEAVRSGKISQDEAAGLLAGQTPEKKSGGLLSRLGFGRK